jgi:hypothetical protein
MDTFLWLLALPILFPFVMAAVFKRTINYHEVAIQVGVMVVLVAIAWFVGTWSATSDTEIWNGEVISKDRKHGQYTESYDCNCRTVTSGSGNNKTTRTVCDTCYREHYTVTWSANTTVGNFRFKHLDRTSRSVYNAADPADYKACQKGQPASREHSYTNYVQAVPDSLFANNEALIAEFAGKIPNQPRVFAHYKYDRIINNGVIDAEQEKLLNDHLSYALKTMGKSHQVNIIVILTKITNPNFKAAVENAWQGGEKNDVVIFVGANADGTVAWADVMTWALNSGNELLQVTLRNELLEMTAIDAANIGQTAVLNISKHYVRPKMKDYEYLKDAIQPSATMIFVILFLSLFVSIGLTWYFHKNDVRFF